MVCVWGRELGGGGEGREVGGRGGEGGSLRTVTALVAATGPALL